MTEICNDNRFELIEKYKNELLEGTNIADSKEEMNVIDNVLFRFWQIGWLDGLENVNRQKEEIERLESNLKFVRGTVERMRKYDEERDVRLHARLTETARTEAIKEFAERLKEFFNDWSENGESNTIYVRSLIDDLVGEMTGDQNDD